MTIDAAFDTALRASPLIAILRGVRPDEAVAVGQVLVDAGFRIIEVPLNSPQPLQSIQALSRAFPQVVIGAGTVLRRTEVGPIQAAGGQLILAPNFNAEVVAEARDLGMACVPGVMTPTEAFAALDAGATGLKLFPAELLGPPAVRALRAVLPAGALLLPVGGVRPDNVRAWFDAGADGLGIGSALYQPGMDIVQLRERALAFMAACAGTMRA
jgi:2-dehydro-3-deoxyphosphogalactonate aldolase